MNNVNLKATPETRDQILRLIALEKMAHDKDHTIKSYLAHLVGLAATGNAGQAIHIRLRTNPAEIEAMVEQIVTEKLATLPIW